MSSDVGTAPSRATMQQIVACAFNAPSGDNLQPWLVDWHDGALSVAIDRNRDLSLYNFRYRASLIALGAMLENLTIAARHFGFDAMASLGADGNDLLNARVVFKQAAPADDPLYPAIDQRCTNRRPYQKVPLRHGVLEALALAVPSDGVSELTFIHDTPRKRALARAASLNDGLLLEWKQLHDGLFDAVRWTGDEAERTRDGLFVKALELGPTALAFRMMRSWPTAKVLRLLGAKAFAPLHSYATFMRSAVFGFLQMTTVTREAYVEGGRRLERLWLTATLLGVSLQPMAGTMCLLPYLDQQPGLLSAAQRATLVKARGVYDDLLHLRTDWAPILLFRLGYDEGPSARSLRRRVAL
jgi:hypothetical protein